MYSHVRVGWLLLFVGSSACFAEQVNSDEQKQMRNRGLEEVIVTAQRREQSLQDTPIAISVLTEKQLLQQGVSSLSDLLGSTISSLNVSPYGSSSSTLVLAIRGNGPGDIAQASRDTSVAVYLDEVYLGRAQGLNLELAELKRIEVLRGPQGTLYGRNATAGAINLISKRPSGELGIRQSLEFGNDNLLSSTTHIDLPRWGGIAGKIDYLYTERDGWVNNTAPGEADFNAFKKKGGRISVDAAVSDSMMIGYTYNDSDIQTTQLYFQFYRDLYGSFGDEGSRQSETRFPVTPLEPTRTQQQLHSLSLNWNLSETLHFLSLTSYSELDDKTRDNWAGTLYSNGLVDQLDVKQDQFSQEFRLTGSQQRLEWVTGLYYYEEATSDSLQQLYSLDIFGLINGTPLTPITPANNFDLYTNTFVPRNTVTTELESKAIYGEATWTPPVLNDQLEITVGVRHTRENKSGARSTGEPILFADPSSHTDPAITFNYHWTDDLSVYTKWSTAYRSGGVNSYSTNLMPFEKEEVETIEFGMKMRGWDNRLLFNTAVFSTDYDGMFIDIFDPNDFTVADTINAAETVTVEGVEIDFSLVPLAGLAVGLSYTYLNGDIPPQPNPLAGNALETFLLTQTPQHTSALTVDYELPHFSFGVLTTHVDVVSSSAYNHWASGGEGHPDGYVLVNAKVDLMDIPLSGDNGRLSFSLWGKNILDEEYVVSSFSLGDAGAVHAFGDPRSAGMAVKYEY